MEPEQLEVIRDALEHMRDREELEQAIGRTVRKRGLSFEFYIQLMGEIRELARREGVSVEKAAKRLLEQGYQHA